MSSIAIIFLMVNLTLLLFLKKQWAVLPLLAGACYMTSGQGIDVGPFSFSVIRLLVAVGLIRVFFRRERVAGGINGLDWLIIAWASWAVISSFFHKDPYAALIFRLGLVYNACGVYFLLRIFCQSIDDVINLSCLIAVMLLAVAVEMVIEKLTGFNYFSIFGGVPEFSAVRAGRIRAQGPFAHAILAGTVGAACLPLMVGIWKQHRKFAILGLGTCITMILACASSGPVLSSTAAIGALLMWQYRNKMRFIRWFAAICYVGLSIGMNAPPYYLIARFKFGGTGWHRAKLIESAFEHINEWWFAGTDYTRHWMPTGVSWSPDHSDITNYYLKMGVIGGLPLMILFIIIFYKSFSYIGKALEASYSLDRKHQFMIWALGASLFAHAATCLSVSYFDQSFLFIYLAFAITSSTYSATKLIAEHEQKKQ